MKLEEVSVLIENGRYDEALTECENLLFNSPEQRIEILRVRAYAFARSDDFESSLKDHESIFQTEKATIRDFYLAAFRALYATEFEKSLDWFTEVLRLGKQQNVTWFLSATLFYLSYVQMQLRDYVKAIEYLNDAVLAEADIGLPIPEIGMCGNEQLREEIERRALGDSTSK